MKNNFNWYLNLFLGILAIVCISIIIIVGLDISSLKRTITDKDFADNMNGVLLNLSYSYITGYLVYLLTVLIPRLYSANIIYPKVKDKYKDIISRLESSISCLSDYKIKIKEESPIPQKDAYLNKIEVYSLLKPKRDNATPILDDLIKNKDQINKRILELLEYRDLLSPNTIVLLEDIKGSKYFSFLDTVKRMPWLDDVEGCTRHTGELLYELYEDVKSYVNQM